MWVSLILRCSASSRVVMLPMSTSPPPLAYLVSAWAEMSTPRPAPSRSNALKASPAPQVLSSALTTPRSRHSRTCAIRSGNSIVTEPAASSHTSFVFGVMRAARSATSIGS